MGDIEKNEIKETTIRSTVSNWIPWKITSI